MRAGPARVLGRLLGSRAGGVHEPRSLTWSRECAAEGAGPPSEVGTPSPATAEATRRIGRRLIEYLLEIRLKSALRRASRRRGWDPRDCAGERGSPPGQVCATVQPGCA